MSFVISKITVTTIVMPFFITFLGKVGDNMSDFIDDKIFIPLLKFSEKHPNLPMIISLISLLVSIIK